MIDAHLPFAATRPVHIRSAHLQVIDLPLISSFYEEVMGLAVLEESNSGAILGTGNKALLELTSGGRVRHAPRGSAGLFHNAFLMPTRNDLARWLRHVVRSRIALEGASDHIVSEALYLADPEGNGIEVYADRSHEGWKFGADGLIEMATKRLDLQALHDSVDDKPWQAAPEGMVLGHIHLQVGDVSQAEQFYNDVLGLKVMARYPGASFFASGGYHHHVAANIWNSRGAGARTPDMSGLRGFTLQFSDKSAFDGVVAALDQLELVADQTADGVRVRDPWGIDVLLRN